MRFARAIVMLMPIWISLAGCARFEDVNDRYGKRRGFESGDSVNGTAVLAGLFGQAGYRVFTWTRLSPKLEQADVIVWAPDDFRPPNAEQREFIHDWLENEPNRTFIYIGRDFDAASQYWRWMRTNASAEQAAEVARRLAQAQVDHDRRRMRMPEEQFVRWFVLRRDKPPTEINELAGPWSDGVNVSETAIRVEARFDVPGDADVREARKAYRPAKLAANASATTTMGGTTTGIPPLNLDDDMEEPYLEDEDFDYLPDYERLLHSGDITLVSRVTESHWDGSQILVVTNGSFLLNMALVNHEHRKLAGHLLAACGDGRVAVFVESGPAGIMVYDEEPLEKYPTGLEVFTVWPMAPIALHFAVLGIITCFWLLPIFGRPVEPDADNVSDFGKHVEALGGLLALTRDESYARTRLRHYYEVTKGEIPAELALPTAGHEVPAVDAAPVSAAPTPSGPAAAVNARME